MDYDRVAATRKGGACPTLGTSGKLVQLLMAKVQACSRRGKPATLLRPYPSVLPAAVLTVQAGEPLK